MSQADENKPHIVSDDDWKERAQAEKEALERQRQGKAAESPQEPQAAPEKEPAADTSEPPPRSGERPQLPPASFNMLVSSLATQAMLALGQMPGPEGKREVQLDLAKHSIDMLDMLETKTEGNLTGEEKGMLSGVLYELRMLYISVRDDAGGTEDAGRG